MRYHSPQNNGQKKKKLNMRDDGCFSSQTPSLNPPAGGHVQNKMSVTFLYYDEINLLHNIIPISILYIIVY